MAKGFGYFLKNLRKIIGRKGRNGERKRNSAAGVLRAYAAKLFLAIKE